MSRSIAINTYFAVVIPNQLLELNRADDGFSTLELADQLDNWRERHPAARMVAVRSLAELFAEVYTC